MIEIEDKVLQLAARRGCTGVSKEDYFKELGGISYGELENTIAQLEYQGLITVEWNGPDQFMVFITSFGLSMINSNIEKRKTEV